MQGSIVPVHCCVCRPDTYQDSKEHRLTTTIMTGLYALQTALVVNGTSIFHNNTGIDGGGLALYRNSFLVLML